MTKLPFDYELFKSGNYEAMAKNGTKVRFVAEIINEKFPLIFVSKDFEGQEWPESYTIEGKYSCDESASSYDLLMQPK